MEVGVVDSDSAQRPKEPRHQACSLLQPLRVKPLDRKLPKILSSLRTRLIEQAVGEVAGAGAGAGAEAGKALLTAGCFSEHPGQTESNIPVHLLTGWASCLNSQAQVCSVH